MVNELDARLRRLRRLVLANHAGIWGSVLVLAALRLGFTDHPTVVRTMVVLTVGGTVLLVASVLVQRRRYGLGAGLIIIANWICAIGATYVTAFITPAGLFGLLLPVVLLFEFLTPAMLRVFISLTVVATGILAGIGEYGRSDEGYEHLPPVVTAPIVTFFVVVVVAIVALGLWNQTHRLTEQATELEASRRRLASAADDARRGIERDLHDGAQQRLSTLSVHLGRVKRLIHSDPAAAEAALAQAHTDLMDAIRELRDLAHGIYPALLEQRGLGPALTAAARRLTHACSVHADGLGRYTAEIENAVYFTCLEALHNADRHSGAEEIRVELTDNGGTLTFVVADDGAGFDTTAPSSPTGGGRGLTGMADRVRAAGGTLRIDSAPGNGTRVTGTITADARD